MPTEPVDDKMAKSIFEMAGIKAIDGLGRISVGLVCCPKACLKDKKKIRTARLM